MQNHLHFCRQAHVSYLSLAFSEAAVVYLRSSHAQRQHVGVGQAGKTGPVYCFPLSSPH